MPHKKRTADELRAAYQRVQARIEKGEKVEAALQAERCYSAAFYRWRGIQRLKLKAKPAVTRAKRPVVHTFPMHAPGSSDAKLRISGEPREVARFLKELSVHFGGAHE